MLYDLSSETDLKRYDTYSAFLRDNKMLVELSKVKKRRTNLQNSYLHLIFGWFALENGETLEYVKQEFFKRQVNPDLFVCEYVNRKTGEIRQDLKSSRDLNTAEMTTAIERFRNWSSKECGIYLPAPNEDKFLESIMIEIKRNEKWI